MKKLLIYLLPVCLLAGSCKKFLEETSPDEIRPSSTDDLYALMISDAYPYSSSMEDFSDMLTDDIKSYGMPRLTNGELNTAYSSYYENGKGIFSFDPLELEGSQGTAASSLNAWKNCYNKIKGCNIIIDYVDKVSGTDVAKNALRGQALLLRGFYYFKLLQLYCAPYNGTGIDPGTTLGVPLILSMQVSDEHVGRSTLKQTFDQVEKDLMEAVTLLEANYTAPNAFRVGHIAAYTLLSRFYLYRGLDADMDKVIDYADRVITERPQLTLLKNFISATNTITIAGIYEQARSSEVIWQYSTNSKNMTVFFPFPTSYSGLHAPYAVSDELRNMYEIGPDNNRRGDLRYAYYFYKYTKDGVEYPSRGAKAGLSPTPGEKGIRTAEVYINAAEALSRRFKSQGNDADRLKSLQYLNTLRESRYDTRNTAYVQVDIQQADSLINFSLAERRRELSLEETFRWADIKRLGLSVTHTFIDADGNSTVYTLPANSLLYALPIPVTAIERNNNLVPNPR
ncbi:RagB/SusD family nutrient uptake outer membrane protein [Chitinophaga tropicalis]|uniref:RagB/SusD family nutrient uptake outer membrane protein n=1 Tax=Chitinophaga tropicalis TaxID=2683588 RepID=A0A7K1U7L9_9BACT|nr:RagB/SusD family nutrient uptake outer membrane protein [Chitinophaga tropicalis]MVT10347.1 RagB/SusD family nutrient uptake outer membrane protein [Chitinophaga tropicalis]